MGFFSLSGFAFVATVAWMEIIWVPSLIAAIACRGGLLLWMFGLALVNRRGNRASRLRVFFRMFLGGVPALAICFVCIRFGMFGDAQQNVSTTATIVIILSVFVLLLIGRHRLIHDRLAGTHLVAR